MITRAGGVSSSRSRMASTSVSVITKMPCPPMPKRWERSFTCIGDSSPVTYITGRGAAGGDAPGARECASCSNSVDLPTPGSPVSSVTDPGTTPPPSTRFSSEDGRGIRGWLSADSVSKGKASPRRSSATHPARREDGAARAAAISVRGRGELHKGLGQKPIHLVLSLPHSWQK